ATPGRWTGKRNEVARIARFRTQSVPKRPVPRAPKKAASRAMRNARVSTWQFPESGRDGFHAGERLRQAEGRRAAVLQDGLLHVAVVHQVARDERGIKLMQEGVLPGYQCALQFAYEFFRVAGE